MGPVYPTGRYDFDNDALLAWGNSRKAYVGGNGNETNSRHTIYKSGMSESCPNCHTEFHAGGTTDFVHPTSEDMGTEIAASYNGCISTDPPTGGTQATPWWGLVPFEAVNADLSTATPSNYTMGPNSSDQALLPAGLSTAAWNSAMATQALAHMEFRIVQSLAGFYEMQDWLERLENTWLRLITEPPGNTAEDQQQWASTMMNTMLGYIEIEGILLAQAEATLPKLPEE